MLLLLVRFFDNLNSDNQKFEALEADPSLLVKSSEFECRCSCQWRHLVPPTKPTPLPLRRQPQAATSIKLVEPSFDTIWLQIFFFLPQFPSLFFLCFNKICSCQAFFAKLCAPKKFRVFLEPVKCQKQTRVKLKIKFPRKKTIPLSTLCCKS